MGYWKVPEQDKKKLIEYFGNTPMPWAQSNPMIRLLAAWVWKKEENEQNGKDKK